MCHFQKDLHLGYFDDIHNLTFPGLRYLVFSWAFATHAGLGKDDF